MKKTLSICCILLLFCLFSIPAETPRFIVNSGHTGAVTSLNYNNNDLLFSSGSDGTVKIWNPDTADIEYQFQVSHMPVKSVTSCSSNPYFAAIESDGINAINLSVWNWETGDRLFKQRLSEIPLFLKFSPKGNFIVYGRTDWNSLVFLDVKTGKQLPYLPDGFGIVSEVFISESEKTLLTYSNSGYLQYWDLSTNQRKTKIPTVANLEQISFVSSGRYMTAIDGNKLVLIDLIRGTRIDSIDDKNVMLSSIDKKNDNLVYITSNGRDIAYHTTRVGSSGFGDTIESEFRNSELPDCLVSINGNIITSFETGNILNKKRYSDELELFSSNNLLDVTDFAVNNNSIAITAPGRILSISSDFFINDKEGALDTEVRSGIYSLNDNDLFGVSTASSDSFLVWPSETDTEGFIRKFNSEEGFSGTITETSTPLISAEYYNGEILTLNKNGECRIIDYQNGETLFEYSSFGLRTVGFIDGNNIIAGRNSSTALPSPLLHINTLTGETVPLEDSNLLIFDLEYDSLTRKLYTLGFEKRNGLTRTVLKEHTGRNHERSETIMAFPGEDIGSAFASDRNSSKIFTSLGFGGVKMLYWGGFTSLENTFSIPRELKLRGNILVSLNQDSSFTIWNPSTGKRVMDLYIFKDLSWAALLSENKYYASSGAEKYINIYSGSTTRELRKTKYKIKTAVN